jgi:hypothetical protein
MDDFESLSHTKWGLQIPRGVHSQVPHEGALRGTETVWAMRFASWLCRRKAGSRRAT